MGLTTTGYPQWGLARYRGRTYGGALRQICDFLAIGSGIPGLLYSPKPSQHGRVLLQQHPQID